MLDYCIGARKHQARVTVVETHHVGRLARGSVDLDNLARTLSLAHDLAVYVQAVSNHSLHCATF